MMGSWGVLCFLFSPSQAASLQDKLSCISSPDYGSCLTPNDAEECKTRAPRVQVCCAEHAGAVCCP